MKLLSTGPLWHRRGGISVATLHNRSKWNKQCDASWHEPFGNATVSRFGSKCPEHSKLHQSLSYLIPNFVIFNFAKYKGVKRKIAILVSLFT